jgi:DNA processing protein
MNTDRLRCWLGLIRAPGLGPMTLLPLLDAGATAVQLVASPSGLPAKLREAIAAIPWELVEQDLAWLAGADNHFLAIDDPDYPALLRGIADPPLGLFVHGDPAVLSLPQLAMVGSRNPSSGGARTAREFAAHLAQAGLAITSGLAVGIDAAAHQGALAGGGITLAVTATGLDRVYPARHRELAHQIAERGALVSEFPPGTPPLPGHFPRRNRIISGLAVGTLVVEAALKSGSLITARQAVEQGREVFAIPGSIHNPLARGCHALIRQGAKLVETADDIAEELTALFGGLSLQATATEQSQSQAAPGLDADYQCLLDALGYDPMTVDALVARTGLAAEAVSSMLLLLELEGHVSSTPGGFFSRNGTPHE